MTTRVLRSPGDIEGLNRYLSSRELPVTVTILKGVIRTSQQNRLQRLWLSEIHEQLPEHTIEEWRGYCKLHLGVPIMRAESEQYQNVYDRLIRHRDYEEKLELMMIPMDLPVTRQMSTSQKNRYLNAMWNEFTQRGVQLTAPPGWLVEDE